MIKDGEIWESYKRGVIPAKKKIKPVAASISPEKSAARKAAGSGPAKAPKANAESALADVRSPLERKREKALRQGGIEIEAKLDLHGMTQVEAFEALASFMRAKVAVGKRHLLIVTGKGRAGTGVLRKNLQNWLGQLPEANMILALRPAALKHGGDGAFYVVLRKKNVP